MFDVSFESEQNGLEWVEMSENPDISFAVSSPRNGQEDRWWLYVFQYLSPQGQKALGLTSKRFYEFLQTRKEKLKSQYLKNEYL